MFTMRTLLLLLFSMALSLYINTAAAQYKVQKLQDVKIKADKEWYEALFPDARAYTETIHEFDTTAAYQRLFAKSVGDTIHYGDRIYKCLNVKKALFIRVSYIYLDGRQLKEASYRDSLRNHIIEQYRAGTPFTELHARYNMDGNSKGGDLGWFLEDYMVKPFSYAALLHRKQDIYTVDVPENKWYYVVLKTFDNTYFRTMEVFSILR